MMTDLDNLGKEWVFADKAPTLPEEHYCATRDGFQARLDTLRKLLNHRSPLTSLLIAICGEIGNNSFDHNLGSWRDTPGIFFSHDIDEKQLVLADRGQGIFTTISRVKPATVDDVTALRVAFTETISGRSPEHRGNGLKFVKDVALQKNIKVFFQSGSGICEIKEGKIAFSSSKETMQGCFAMLDYREAS